MIQVGLLYPIHDRLPPFSLFERLKEDEGVTPILREFGERGFDNAGAANDSVFVQIRRMEEAFLQQFLEAVDGDVFFRTLLALKMHMPNIRMRMRDALLRRDEESGILEEVRLATRSFPRLNKRLVRYITQEMPKKELSVRTLEADLDGIYLDVLAASIPWNAGVYRSYVAMLQRRRQEDMKLRRHYTIDEASHEGKVFAKNELFRDMAEEECRFANRATIEFDPSLIALQCYVSFTYAWYDARVIASVRPADRASILVNYTVSA